MDMTPEELEALRAERTAQLHELRTTDPVAWCIITKSRGIKAIAETLVFTTKQVETEINRLLKAKAIKKKRYMKTWIYQAESREMKRLYRRAQAIKFQNRKLEELGG